MEIKDFKLIDCHCHIFEYNNDILIENIIKECISNNIKYIIELTTKLSNFEKVKSLCKKYEILKPNYGFHPCYINEIPDNYIDILKNYLLEDNNSNLGEIGLDFINKDNKKKQIEIFKNQLVLGIELKRSISIHSIRSLGEVLKILKKNIKNVNTSNIIMHSYGGSIEITKSLLKLNSNIYFSFSLFSYNKIDELLQIIPIEKILLETDSPYQFNDKIKFENLLENNYNNNIKDKYFNKPYYINKMLNYISLKLEIEINKLNNIIYNNSLKAFRI